MAQGRTSTSLSRSLCWSSRQGYEPGKQLTVTVVTDHEGKYSFPIKSIGPGRYNLCIRAAGYDLSLPLAVDKKAQGSSLSKIMFYCPGMGVTLWATRCHFPPSLIHTSKNWFLILDTFPLCSWLPMPRTVTIAIFPSR